MVKSTKYRHFLIIIWFTYDFMGYLLYHSAFILWFDRFLDSGAEISQIWKILKDQKDILKLTDLYNCSWCCQSRDSPTNSKSAGISKIYGRFFNNSKSAGVSKIHGRFKPSQLYMLNFGRYPTPIYDELLDLNEWETLTSK